jgi:tRNA (guanine37-N1)-methyltransferase
MFAFCFYVWHILNMNFHIITLFPESFDSYVNSSILKRAIFDKKIKVNFYNPRDFVKNENHRVDQKPYGGGPGMVIEALPVLKAIEKAKGKKKKVKIIFLTPAGNQFNNKLAKNYSENFKDIIIVCGRYEGIDARIKKIFKMDEISIGPFVLTGGELPAMIILDTVARQIKGVLGNSLSIEENRISAHDVYTRPEILVYKNKKYKVPEVLLSGNHAEIEKWKKNSI